MTEICPHEQCTGCTACASACPKHAISMQRDEWGFLYPQVDEAACINCRLCQKVCPAQNAPARQSKPEEMRFRAVWHRDAAVRAASSSGGAFSALASTVLKRGGYVCGAAFSDDYHAVRHLIIHHEEELPRLRTSKYLQSNMGQTYTAVQKLLNAGAEVLFTGTPCQVAGLHLFLRREYPNLTTADIVCHGVPSPKVYDDYIGWLETMQGGKLLRYHFRDKRWSWTRFNMRADFSNGNTYYGKWETDLYYRGFVQDLYLRDCCYQCAFSACERPADITMADFWGAMREPRPAWADEKGISMCITHTQKGEQLLRDAEAYLVSDFVPRYLALSNSGFQPLSSTPQIKHDFQSLYREKGFAAAVEERRLPVKMKLYQKVLYRFGRKHLITRIMDALGVFSRRRRCRRSQRRWQRENR